MEKVFNLAKAIASVFAGKATERQKRDIEAWKNEAEENSHLLEKMTDEDYLMKDRESLARFDKEEAWRKVCEKQGLSFELPERTETGRRIVPIWKYVAAVAVLAIGGGLGWWMVEREQDMQVAEIKQEIREHEEPKGVKLRLQNGNLVDLENSDGVVQVEAGGIVANKDGSLLAYSEIDTDENVEIVYNEIEVPWGTEFQLKLSDGTKIYLNSVSRVRYPVTFPKGERRIELEGEAFLEVAKDSARPFIVETQYMDVQVLGTKFNISAYGDDPTVMTTLVEGSVRVSSEENGVEAVLKPSEQLVFNKEEKTAEVRQVDVKYYTAWRDGWFRFQDVSLEDLMKVLMRWYDLEVVYADPEVKEYRFGCNFNRMSPVETLIKVFGENGKIKIEQKDGVLVIKKGR